MAIVGTQTLPLTGAALTYSAAAAGGDRFTPGPRTFLHVRNGGASSVSVTLTVTATVDGMSVGGGSRVVAVPAGADRLVPVPAATYQAVDGLADVAWSATTSVTFAVAIAP
ncbi:hypothetical protein [Pseudonocardia hydrocarbonoxydans]|uniref:Uncharacterized protein n=1 Tax=Pseudonocardia hydrocarbonoxydans TaxID=76726 RepID=A0A4Y3WQD5_9PSEU|nr:hypothetical protein [Pseudonocardia hydrocarbonoxydans]GEC20984.1 hypothetical protein PHY01_32670 [Pseudonocardia hydrocarbonoxydans]